MDDLSVSDSLKLALYFATRDLFFASHPEVEPEDLNQHMGTITRMIDNEPVLHLIMRFRFGAQVCVPLSDDARQEVARLDIPKYEGAPNVWVSQEENLHSLFYTFTELGLEKLARLTQTNPAIAKSIGI